MDDLSNLGLIFTSPGTVARNLTQKPAWVVPLVLVVLITLVVTYGVHGYQVEFQKAAVEKALERSGREIDIDEILKDTPGARLMSGAMVAVFTVAFLMLLPAAILNGISSVAGSKVGFRRMFALLTHAGLIVAAGSLVRWPLIVAKGNFDARTSLAAFAPGLAMDSPLGTLLNSIDVFSVWAVVAVCVGFSVLSQIDIKKSALVVVALWLAGVGLLVLAAIVRTMTLGAAQ